jgi:hypothetical protein
MRTCLSINSKVAPAIIRNFLVISKVYANLPFDKLESCTCYYPQLSRPGQRAAGNGQHRRRASLVSAVDDLWSSRPRRPQVFNGRGDPWVAYGGRDRQRAGVIGDFESAPHTPLPDPSLLSADHCPLTRETIGKKFYWRPKSGAPEKSLLTPSRGACSSPRPS